MCQLTGQEVANASMYDGSTALTEAVLMAERLTSRHRMLIARSVHPEYRQVLHTYAKNLGLTFDEIGYTASGQVDRAALANETFNDAAAVVVQSPNFFGVIEEIPALAEVAHAGGALLVDGITEAVSLGIVRPPAEADIVAMEVSESRHPAQLWRPVRRRDRHARKIRAPDARPPRRTNHRRRRPPRIRAHARHARAAHPPRKSHLQHLHQRSALRAGRHHSSLPARQRGACASWPLQNLAKARFAHAELEKVPGVRRVFSGPMFNEFVLEFPRSVKLINAGCCEKKSSARWRSARISGSHEARPRLRHRNHAARRKSSASPRRSSGFWKHRL